jgi:hypothetical protein
MSLYLDKDSIFHSNLGFSFNASEQQVNLFRANNPVSKSPYFDSFHRLDMYFELLSWNMKESKVLLSRAKGAALGQAEFESVSFFNADYFMKLAGIDDYHPLVSSKISRILYSTTSLLKNLQDGRTNLLTLLQVVYRYGYKGLFSMTVNS